MAGSKKSSRLGVIAEEYNDIDVLYEYTAKLIAENSFRFLPFVGHGCGEGESVEHGRQIFLGADVMAWLSCMIQMVATR